MRRLHIQLALEYPLVVDVELNEVLAKPDEYWQKFVQVCAADTEQALFVAQVESTLVGMGHIHRQDPLARLVMLYVEGNKRRQGIGTALVTAQTNWAHQFTVTDLVCHIPG